MPADPNDILEQRSQRNSYFSKRRFLRGLSGLTVLGGIGGISSYIISSVKESEDSSITDKDTCMDSVHDYLDGFDTESFYDSINSSKGDEEYDSQFNLYRDGRKVIDDRDKQIFEKSMNGTPLSDEEAKYLEKYLEEENVSCDLEN